MGRRTNGVILLCLMLHLASAGADRPFRWDMGPRTQPPERSAIRVDARSFYTPARGYGFLTRTQTEYSEVAVRSLGIGSIADGVTAAGMISFRIDTPPGKYVVEVLIDGGTHTEWTGVIAVNGTRIAGPLHSFSANSEGEMPPPFRGVIRTVTTDRPYLVIDVRASGEATTIAGVGCYPEMAAPVSYRGTEVVANDSLHAPNADLILRLINAGRTLEARRTIDAVPDQFAVEKASFLFALASRLEVDGAFDLIARGRALLERSVEAGPDPQAALGIRLAELLIDRRPFRPRRWLAMGEGRLRRLSGSLTTTTRRHVLHRGFVAPRPSSVLLRPCGCRHETAYWLWVEQHDDPMIQLADSTFRLLKDIFPSSRLLCDVSGEDALRC